MRFVFSRRRSPRQSICQRYSRQEFQHYRHARCNPVICLIFDKEGVMRFQAWRGLSNDYRQSVEGHSPWKPDSKDPKPLLVPDILDEPSLDSLRPTIEAEGIRSLAFIPLISARRL